MSFSSTLKSIKFPDTKEALETPSRIREETDKTNLNHITVMYFTRKFAKCIRVKGVISHETSVPIIYFNKPENLGIIDFDNTSFYDETLKELCIIVSEDYLFSLDMNSEYKLIHNLKIQYYNDTIRYKAKSKDIKKIGNRGKLLFEKTNCAYMLPIFLNNIPREVIKINIENNVLDNTIQDSDVEEKNTQIEEKILNDYDKKIEVTQYIVRQFATVKMLSNLQKPNNSIIIACALMFIPLGLIMGIFITLFFFR